MTFASDFELVFQPSGLSQPIVDQALAGVDCWAVNNNKTIVWVFKEGGDLWSPVGKHLEEHESDDKQS